ncbi:MAG: DsbA family protein [Pseudomonadota bacterium]
MTKNLTRRTALASGVAGAATLIAPPLRAREVVEMSKGDASAPIEVVEYASFTCPHCASFHTDVYPQIRANFIETGKVRFVMREVYFDKYGLWAGMLARCGGEMRYFGIVDMIFVEQNRWLAPRPDDRGVIAELFSLGRRAGLTDDQMDACMNDQAFAEALVAEYQRNAEADNVRGTPSFKVNGRMVSNMGYAEFASVLNAELES